MYSFKNDYTEGAHPRILQALIESNFDQEDGYGEDRFTQKAISLLKEKMENANVDIHLVSGGTQTNLTAISAFLRPHEAVIATTAGHVFTHETGAIEATGHKVISVETEDGKLNPAKIKDVLNSHTDEHMVKPKLVYISNTTEIGSIYNKRELKDLKAFCEEYNLFLYMDGARLGSALCSVDNDLQLSDIPALVDAFYIGGTKNGALIRRGISHYKKFIKRRFSFSSEAKRSSFGERETVGYSIL